MTLMWIGELHSLQYEDLEPATWYTSRFGLNDLTKKIINSIRDTSEQHAAVISQLCGAVKRGDLELTGKLLDRGLAQILSRWMANPYS
jgi:hypothetical protein